MKKRKISVRPLVSFGIILAFLVAMGISSCSAGHKSQSWHPPSPGSPQKKRR